MKTALILVAIGAVLVAAILAFNSRQRTVTKTEVGSGPDRQEPSVHQVGGAPSNRTTTGAAAVQKQATAREALQAKATARTEPRLAEGHPIHPGFEALLDAQSSFQRKQEVWAELTSSGKLDVAIAELEKRARDNPDQAEIPAALGRAYLQKAGAIDDVREQGMLGMKADQALESALNLDAKNWDARFWKAMAMSHWPVQLNKTPEVIDDLNMLLQQQEGLSPRPEFAQTYVLLGEQYTKVSRQDYAKQAWERGLALFPEHAGLKEKLANRP
jgi:tetratricopeptide (TPR) repeat protein